MKFEHVIGNVSASLLAKLPEKGRSLVSFRARAAEFSGMARESSNVVTLLYVGNGTNLAFCLNVAFDTYSVKANYGRCNIWNATSFAHQNAADADITIFDVPWPYEIDLDDDDYVLETPSWVRQELMLKGSWEEIVANFHKNVRGAQLRIIRKNKLSCQTTNEDDAVDSFYQNMYAPHIKRRFGQSAHVDSEADVRQAVRQGTLLQILRGTEVVAACVLHHCDQSLRMPFIGFSASDLRSIDGASAALYYFSIKYASDQSFKDVDFCGTRPLLNNGVFTTKRSWGAAVYDDWALESLLIRFKEYCPGIESFLVNNSLIVRHEGQLVGKTVISDAQLSPELTRKIIHRCAGEGLDGLYIYSLRGVQDDAYAVADSNPTPVRLFDLQKSDDPLAVYCDS